MKHQIDLNQVKKAQMTLRALNHKLRQEILSIIEKKGNMNVTEIYVKLKVDQPVASQHLAILRIANIVNAKRDGKTIWYSVNFDRIKEIEKYTKELLG
jgi:DNA-binding transcriptional ArsR family regulator